MAVMAILGLVTSMMQNNNQQQAQQASQKAEARKLQVIPSAAPWSPTAGPANSRATGLSSYPSASRQPDSLDLTPKGSPSGGGGGMDIKKIMQLFSLFSSMKGGGNSGGFFSAADSGGYQSSGYDTGGLNSAFSSYQDSQLGSMGGY